MSKNVLVAESDSTIQQVVSYFLGLEGFDVITAGDGVAALEEIEKSLPDAILLDPGLAGINGIEVSRLIREKSQFNNIPILFLTDSIDSLLKMSSDIPPGYGVINKPIDPTKMANTVKEYIEKSKQSDIEQSESVSIEELLGWEVTEEKKEKGAMSQEGQQEVPGIFSEMAGMEGLEVISKESEAGYQRQEMQEVAQEEIEKTEVRSQKSEEESWKSVASPLPEEELRGLFISKKISDDSMAMEALGSVDTELRGRITDEMIENMISKIARDIIEKVTWEVVPKIAEEEIKKEIERLKNEDK